MQRKEREFIGFIRRTEVGVVRNGWSLQVCMFVLLGSARKNDMPCYFVSSGQPKKSYICTVLWYREAYLHHISLPHFFGIERPYLHHISLPDFFGIQKERFASHLFATFLWYGDIFASHFFGI